MHEIHVCHLAVVDLLAGILAIIPVFSGNVVNISKKHSIFFIPCFVSALGTHSCNIMALTICIFISFDRLRLLQLGIRYHMTHSRTMSIFRITLAWVLIISFTLAIAIYTILSPKTRQRSHCAYTFYTDHWLMKTVMTLIGLGPLSSLVALNCMVRHKVRQLESHHPTLANQGRFKFGGISGQEDCTEMEGSTNLQPSTEPPTTAPLSTTLSGSSTENLGKHTPNETKSYSKTTVWGILRNDRTLSRRATASIFLSTLTFILCLSPLAALLVIEAWWPTTVTASTHRWHLWLTLGRTAVDPFLFARSVPSFRSFFRQGAGGGARTRDRWVPEYFRVDSLSTMPPTPPLSKDE
ncbi:vesicular glutamate transporter 3 [Plakobranchus ocellatus]|uniref:Vesicular glutamate transporter 3 n=1 Tax=Plakobranchus ocellatus TaxID=259542 RepID=A0AAV4ANJ0_9GAST|nr:vesicular glutamate transporter 3 [Plakobranchus ocellatus]